MGTLAERFTGGEQVGELWSRSGPHAAMWRGSVETLIDLNPPGFEASRGLACAGGLQVGFAKRKQSLDSGVDSPETRAFVWAGGPESFVDLQDVVPAPWNASAAHAIEVSGDRVRIAGVVEQYDLVGGRVLRARQACVWAATIR